MQNNRVQDLGWSFNQIDNLIKQSYDCQNPSLVIYAALESRNIIERIEFESIVMSANSSFSIEDFENIKKRLGIQKANNKFNTLKYRYQLFAESFSKAVKPDLNVKSYDFKKAEEIKRNLSQYLHIYSRTNEELEFNSKFIQDGYHIIQSAIDFLKNFLQKDINGFYFVIVDFMTLAEPMKNEFQSWLSCNEENNEKLTERLINIVNNAN